MGPVVQQCTNKPISIIVERRRPGEEGKELTGPGGGQTPGAVADAPVEHVRLTLVPSKWGGQGLTGCKLVEVPPPEKPKPQR